MFELDEIEEVCCNLSTKLQDIDKIEYLQQYLLIISQKINLRTYSTIVSLLLKVFYPRKTLA